MRFVTIGFAADFKNLPGIYGAISKRYFDEVLIKFPHANVRSALTTASRDSSYHALMALHTDSLRKPI